MAIIKPRPRSSLQPKVVALTPLNLYYERIKSITDSLRASAKGLDYIPLQFGGILGQQESLLANATVKIIDFEIPGVTQ